MIHDARFETQKTRQGKSANAAKRSVAPRRRLHDKVAIVTGSTSGIGTETARAFAMQCATVCGAMCRIGLIVDSRWVGKGTDFGYDTDPISVGGGHGVAHR